MDNETNEVNEVEGETQLLIWGVPSELKQKFKAQCATNKITMRQAILDFMKDYTSV